MGRYLLCFPARVAGRKAAGLYNNAPKTLELNIPVENTPLETAHQWHTVFGNTSAELVTGKVHVSLRAQTLAVFSMR